MVHFHRVGSSFDKSVYSERIQPEMTSPREVESTGNPFYNVGFDETSHPFHSRGVTWRSTGKEEDPGDEMDPGGESSGSERGGKEEESDSESEDSEVETSKSEKSLDRTGGGKEEIQAEDSGSETEETKDLKAEEPAKDGSVDEVDKLGSDAAERNVSDEVDSVDCFGHKAAEVQEGVKVENPVERAGGKPDELKTSGAAIIQATIAVLTAMTLLDGFGDEKGERFGAGAKKLESLAERLGSAWSDPEWQGVAAHAYDTRNSRLRDLIEQMADADKTMAHRVSEHAEKITATRIALGTNIGFLTACGFVAAYLESLGQLAASIALQIQVCTPALGVCATMQGLLIKHAEQTASSIHDAIAHYHQVSAGASAMRPAMSLTGGAPTGAGPTGGGVGRPTHRTPRVTPDEPTIPPGALAGPATPENHTDDPGDRRPTPPPPRPHPVSAIPHTAAQTTNAGLPATPSMPVQPRRSAAPTPARPGATPQTPTPPENTPKTTRTATRTTDADDQTTAATTNHPSRRAPINDNHATSHTQQPQNPTTRTG
ncbi:hypothetical protein H7H78_07030 [Mycobacterium shinjukuense]|nr:EspA/EspE family type VII secretion system effector [Mycobacterium shinjukuense]MCV6985203.1 hypothetical protein [Mycobacterium shinjukuense]